MKSITKLIELKKIRSKTKNWKSVGFIPTMGAIHEGHLSLVRQSKNENDITVVSIYVNPTQFNNRNDYENYPGDLEQDLALLTNAGVSYCLLPTYDELYSDRYRFRVNETDHSKIMEGKKRPGHIGGVYKKNGEWGNWERIVSGMDNLNIIYLTIGPENYLYALAQGYPDNSRIYKSINLIN